MLKSFKFLLFIIFFSLPIFVFSQVKNEIIFQARVLNIIEQKKNILGDGAEVEQQKIKLKGLEKEYKDKEIIFDGFNNFDLAKKNLYKEGDRVLVLASTNDQGEINYYITDYVRTESLFYLFILFVIILLLIGGIKGLRSIFSLVVTFLIVIKYIIPSIIAGANALVVTIIGSFFILLFIIYITEGFCLRSHIAIASIFFSLVLTIFLSKIFIYFAHLSGLADEDSIFLLTINNGQINFQGLLLAGIIIGTLGVLDDVVISQVTSVEQIIKTNYEQSKKEVFKKAYEIGISHISSMTNTLFLAYAGASLPLLILFISGGSVFVNWGEVVNNEQIATEIIRTLAGSIGLILSVPLSTLLAVYWMGKK